MSVRVVAETPRLLRSASDTVIGLTPASAASVRRVIRCGGGILIYRKVQAASPARPICRCWLDGRNAGDQPHLTARQGNPALRFCIYRKVKEHSTPAGIFIAS